MCFPPSNCGQLIKGEFSVGHCSVLRELVAEVFPSDTYTIAEINSPIIDLPQKHL